MTFGTRNNGRVLARSYPTQFNASLPPQPMFSSQHHLNQYFPSLHFLPFHSNNVPHETMVSFHFNQSSPVLFTHSCQSIFTPQNFISIFTRNPQNHFLPHLSLHPWPPKSFAPFHFNQSSPVHHQNHCLPFISIFTRAPPKSLSALHFNLHPCPSKAVSPSFQSLVPQLVSPFRFHQSSPVPPQDHCRPFMSTNLDPCRPKITVSLPFESICTRAAPKSLSPFHLNQSSPVPHPPQKQESPFHPKIIITFISIFTSAQKKRFLAFMSIVTRAPPKNAFSLILIFTRAPQNHVLHHFNLHPCPPESFSQFHFNLHPCHRKSLFPIHVNLHLCFPKISVSLLSQSIFTRSPFHLNLPPCPPKSLSSFHFNQSSPVPHPPPKK